MGNLISRWKTRNEGGLQKTRGLLTAERKEKKAGMRELEENHYCL